ncbi:hypothetical protein G9C85_05700 [Halorubellus sp. JP-L1]|uniref:hypothetical protein n=1 Tax=Halorubellus sp. JP-L1 TaxID=2715753 RepID=UPI00140A0F54|nr:hypothetical protein [Halorubellus sp. JP-L1]NHN41130.1 hypothetical protein [Halorubellus sp. JP-L1]
MSTSQSAPAVLTPTRVASAAAVLAGLGLASYGGYTQYTISRAVADGACDGCAPWHPLFVVAPLVVGVVLVAIGSYAFAKTTC